MEIWLDDLRITDTIETATSVFTQKQVINFAISGGDENRLHLDIDYAKNRPPFRKRIVHGELIATRMSALGAERIGYGPILLQTSTKTLFRAPVCVGEIFTCHYEVTEIKNCNNKYGTVCFATKLFFVESKKIIAYGERELIMLWKPF
ncbi:MAG: Acyl dehydratase [candidate division CPR2 bacterium GW2011_GWC1_39_9]|uniref:Acyl dehydratase n=1 Tax=candidate division CPR2 bacterium GW2011_GWC2_39_10 TaxID=1618345 RepID=A0A0G0LQ23_UNCC2|nr:MAG: Acyl dehydratase [candidate division CPR2 bacterium GW2011_GWC2_39_10]KKR33444.1 MAG: Acyl dehydratase [candidate division CPR2 bacterium GW2011_GWC1_39_9]